MSCSWNKIYGTKVKSLAGLLLERTHLKVATKHTKPLKQYKVKPRNSEQWKVMWEFTSYWMSCNAIWEFYFPFAHFSSQARNSTITRNQTSGEVRRWKAEAWGSLFKSNLLHPFTSAAGVAKMSEYLCVCVCRCVDVWGCVFVCVVSLWPAVAPGSLSQSISPHTEHQHPRWLPSAPLSIQFTAVLRLQTPLSSSEGFKMPAADMSCFQRQRKHISVEMCDGTMPMGGFFKAPRDGMF